MALAQLLIDNMPLSTLIDFYHGLIISIEQTGPKVTVLCAFAICVYVLMKIIIGAFTLIFVPLNKTKTLEETGYFAADRYFVKLSSVSLAIQNTEFFSMEIENYIFHYHLDSSFYFLWVTTIMHNLPSDSNSSFHNNPD